MLLSRIIGASGALWGLLYGSFYLLNNPYVNAPPESDVLSRFTLLLFLPCIIALFASILYKQRLLFICFIWSFPLCLYLAGTPGVFKWVALTPVLFLTAGIMMKFSKKKHNSTRFL
jgi:hypothetical protein